LEFSRETADNDYSVMVSIRKYLDMTAPRGAEPIESAGGGSLSGLCSGILDHIGAYVLTAERDSDARATLEHEKTRLYGKIDADDAERIGNAVRDALAGHAEGEKEAIQRNGVETQQVVSVLNQALMVMAGGSERSVSRLERIQEALRRTSLIRDNAGLRASLADATKLIGDEYSREQERGARDLAAFESEVIRVREQITANPVLRLPGRAEAIESLSARRLALKVGSSLFVVAYSFENISAIVHRYGPEPVDALSFQVIRERTQPLAAVNTSWRWAQGCVVSAFERPGDLAHLRVELTELSRDPLVYHMSLGSRNAVLKVRVSHLAVAASPQSMPTLIDQIDRFSGIAV
jgi:hypothetical protein